MLIASESLRLLYIQSVTFNDMFIILSLTLMEHFKSVTVAKSVIAGSNFSLNQKKKPDSFALKMEIRNSQTCLSYSMLTQ